MEITNQVLWHMLGYLSEVQWEDAYKHFADKTTMLEGDFKELLLMFDKAYRTTIYQNIYG